MVCLSMSMVFSIFDHTIPTYSNIPYSNRYHSHSNFTRFFDSEVHLLPQQNSTVHDYDFGCLDVYVSYGRLRTLRWRNICCKYYRKGVDASQPELMDNGSHKVGFCVCRYSQEGGSD